MATRFYFSSTEVAEVSPAFAAGWERNTEGDRFMMSPTKDGSAFANKTFGGGADAAASAELLARQYVSKMLAAGIAFVTSDTLACVIMAGESNADDNLQRVPSVLRVFSSDGSTVLATLRGLSNYGPTTEWPTSGLINRRYFDGDVVANNYTTVGGERLVLEVGGQVVSGTGGTSVTGTMEFGSASGTDLSENNTDTTTGRNPWFEISRDITFIDAGPLVDSPILKSKVNSGLTA